MVLDPSPPLLLVCRELVALFPLRTGVQYCAILSVSDIAQYVTSDERWGAGVEYHFSSPVCSIAHRIAILRNTMRITAHRCAAGIEPRALCIRGRKKNKFEHKRLCFVVICVTSEIERGLREGDTSRLLKEMSNYFDLALFWQHTCIYKCVVSHKDLREGDTSRLLKEMCV